MDYSNVVNIIVAAGSGSRFGGELPKQYCLLDGIPVLIHTLRHIKAALPKSTCIVVVHADYLNHVRHLTEQFALSDVIITTGGTTRWESVKKALDTVITKELDADVITIHDAARPLVTDEVAQTVVAACSTHSGAIPTIAVTDSLRMIDALPARSIAVDRTKYRAVQTPQAFKADQIKNAYQLPYQPNFTDDASVMTAAGFTDIALVEGDTRNIKITHPQDMDIASIYLKTLQ